MTISLDDIISAADELAHEESFRKIQQEIADTFFEIRHEKGWSQREAAEAASTTKARVSDLELAKKDLLLSTIVRYAHGYGYQVEIAFIPIKEE